MLLVGYGCLSPRHLPLVSQSSAIPICLIENFPRDLVLGGQGGILVGAGRKNHVFGESKIIS